MEPINWTRLTAARRQLTGLPEDDLIQARMETWRRRLIRKDRLGEEALDSELLDLLQQIQEAF